VIAVLWWVIMLEHQGEKLSSHFLRIIQDVKYNGTYTKITMHSKVEVRSYAV